MSLVFTILIGLLVLVGLIATFLTIKHWHWGQMLLMLGVYLASVGVLVLGAEVYRIHKLLRMNLPKVEAKLEQVEEKNAALQSGSRVPGTITAVVNDLRNPEAIASELAGQEGQEQLAQQLQWLGTNEMAKEQLDSLLDRLTESGKLPSLDTWDQQNQALARQRGRVWRGAVKTAGPDDSGTVQIAIPMPRPHGLEQDSVVYVFQMGEPNANNPSQGAQYLGEFRVTAAAPDSATLAPVLPLDERTSQRLANSQAPLSIYETMPPDRHELFGHYDNDTWVSDYTEEELRQMLPAATVEEYLRHGSAELTRDDDEYHRQAFDDEFLPIGPESDKPVAYERYDRPLRAYEIVFNNLAAEKATLIARLAAAAEDAKKLKTAIDEGQQLQAERQEEKRLLNIDKDHMLRDLAVIRDLSETITQRLAVTKELLQNGLQANAQLAAELTRRQLAILSGSEQ
ncbi:MAG: hypothetical protein CMJ58_25890 [Planctomycetaceae bacterium]|nr:hypothetical protein [Planctomycetaceae bacterium]